MMTQADWQRDWARENLKSLLKNGGDMDHIDQAIKYLGEEGEVMAKEYGYPQVITVCVRDEEKFCECGGTPLPESEFCKDCI